MSWTKWIGLILQIMAFVSAMSAGKNSMAPEIPNAAPATLVAGQPLATYGYGAGALTLATAGTLVAGAGAKSKLRSTVTAALREIAADAAESGDSQYCAKVAELAFVMKGRRQSTVVSVSAGGVRS